MSYKRGHYEDGWNKKEKGKRKRRQSSSEEEEEDNSCYFDFSRHKSKLNKIFFRDEDFVKQGSKEYDEFWQFLSKYQVIGSVLIG